MRTPGPEGLVLGAGNNLPDASVVQNFDFSKAQQLSFTVWELPEHPDALLRLQRDTPGDQDACWQLARQGIRHLRELQDEGITMPAQRFVVGPDKYSRWRKPRLYAVTERLPEGHDLTFEPNDAARAETVINAHAKYLLRRVVNPGAQDPAYIFDSSYPWQYTVFDTKGDRETDFSLHDTGLEFASVREPAAADTLRGLGLHLLHWANHAGVDRTPALNQLLQRVESREQRLARLAKEVIKPSLRRPQTPPPNWFKQ